MSTSEKNQELVFVREKLFRKEVILADVNVPYKFSIDRRENVLYFCINADEFSDQSFHNVVLNLNTRSVKVITNIQNGFASAVDHVSGSIYLGGSNGIYKYNYETHHVERPAVVKGIYVFDMQYKNYLYFVDTANLYLYVFKNNEKSIILNVEEYGINHFVIDESESLIFANPSGLFYLSKFSKSPIKFFDNIPNVRGLTTDIYGMPYLIAEKGIFSIDVGRMRSSKLLSLEDGYGLAFDRENNIIFSEQLTVVKLTPVE